MSGLPRLLLGSAFLSSPFFFILFVLVMTEALDATSAWLAAILGYAGVVLLFRPLITGLQAIQAALLRMSDDEIVRYIANNRSWVRLKHDRCQAPAG